MKKVIMFSYSITAYLLAFVSIVFWILSIGNLIPEVSIDGPPKVPFGIALLTNTGLVLLFGLQHSIMARKPFKDFFTRYFPKPIERSTFVLFSSLLLFVLLYGWQPMGGTIWTVPKFSIAYYSIYVLFFIGWFILFLSTFLISHFDMFGVRQTFLELQKKPYEPLGFKIGSLYKYVRHPLYFGMLLAVWATTNMTVTHLVFAVGVTIYVIFGATLEERDLVKEFGRQYQEYQKRKPMLIPFTKRRIKN
ncbi:methyltransferase family protein [Ulvibacterium marinum]|uniref:methyltransferase family protein n=1 Tax=Ulvibacterium marinum TaxID=2419782 RepID=UPI0024946BB4|nr:NnrU family protein [Ulvibacterium marinum]